MVMKTLFKSCLFVLFLNSCLFSADFSLGARAGLNLSTISGNDVQDEYLTLLPGITGGFLAEVHFTNFFALRTELIYSAKGVKWEYDRSEEENEEDYAKDISRVHYIEIPMNMLFSLPNNKKISPFIYGGVAASFFLGADKKVTINDKEVLNESKDEAARNLDFGIDFGGGIGLRMGKGKLLIDARYTIGLLSVEKEGYDEVKNRTLYISVGYSVAFGKGNKQL
jgi:hypothetical protein